MSWFHAFAFHFIAIPAIPLWVHVFVGVLLLLPSFQILPLVSTLPDTFWHSELLFSSSRLRGSKGKERSILSITDQHLPLWGWGKTAGEGRRQRESKTRERNKFSLWRGGGGWTRGELAARASSSGGEVQSCFSCSFFELCLDPLLFLSSSSSCSSSHFDSPPSSRRGVSALHLPAPLPGSLPPPGAAGSSCAAAAQEDVSQGVSTAAFPTSTDAGSAEGGVRGPSRAGGAAVRRRDGDHPAHMGARLQELWGCGGVCAHKVRPSDGSVFGNLICFVQKWCCRFYRTVVFISAPQLRDYVKKMFC